VFVTPGRIVALEDRVSRVSPLVGSACRGDGRLTLVGSIDYQFSFYPLLGRNSNC
jgi:hypothetical protein